MGLPDSENSVDQIMQEVADDSPLMAVNSSITPQAGNSGHFGSNSNISWSVDERDMTLKISALNPSGNMTVTEFASSLPWKGSFTNTDIFRVKIECALAPTNLTSWFAGYTSLVSFEASTLDASGVASFANMFNGCTNLEYVTGIGNWDTSHGSDFTGMFNGCAKLKELDLTNWTINSGAKRPSMFGNMGAIEKMTLSNKMILEGTGFGSTASRGDNAGTWKTNAWSGTSRDLVALYGSSTSRPSDVLTYTFYYESSFATNADVLWSFDGITGTLTIDATGASNKIVGELAADLPWLPSVGSAAVRAVVTIGGVAPNNLSSWFANYANLVNFNGSGMDVSATTSFAGLFKGDTFLNSVNLTDWNMDPVKSADRTDMFANCTALMTLAVTNGVILDGTGLSDLLAKRTPSAGTWDCSDGVWFGTTGNLAARYSSTKNASDRPTSIHGALIYTWHPNQIGGRFENDNAWWRFSGIQDGILTLGADLVDCHGNAIGASAKKVTESAARQPWLLSGALVNGAFSVRSVITRNGIAPVDLTDWFSGGYLQLTIFDGSGMDVQFCTSFANLFAGSTITTVNLSGWVMDPAADRTHMFDSNPLLRRLTLSDHVILTGSGISDLVDHGTSNGSWATEDSSWFGSSENLVARYPESASTPGHATGTFTYIWDPSMRSGRFEGNDSVYWIFTNGTITIGADAGSTNTIVTQDSANLPWRDVIRKEMVTSVVFRETGDASNPTRVKAINFGGNGTVTDGWFADYQQLVSFNGAGVDLSLTTSLKNLFRYCISLNSLIGIAGWDTSNITTFEGLFDECKLMTVQPSVGSWDTSKVENFSYMFRNAKDLVTVDALAGWDVSAAKTFLSMFEGANFIVTLDVSGWNMPADADRTNMFAFLDALSVFKVCDGVILVGTGLDDAIYGSTRIDSAGSWDCSDGIWFGTTHNLASRYSGNCIVPGALTYTWSSNNLRGRFDSNDNAWWRFDRTAGGLALGTDEYKGTGPNPNPDVINRTVTEAANQVPWLRAMGENVSVLVQMVSVAAGEDFNPTNIAGWFKNYHRLSSFDGTGIVLTGNTSLEQLFFGDELLSSVTGLNTWDVSNITSFASMFEGAASLTQLAGVSGWHTNSLTNLNGMFRNASSLLLLVEAAGWDVSKVTDFGGMFDGAANLATLDISGWIMDSSAERARMFADCGKLGTVAAFGPGAFTINSGIILEGTSFNSDLQGLLVTQGSWAGTPDGASSSTWFGSTTNLASRYPAAKNGEGSVAGKMVYVWRAGVMAGRFENDNTWWTFNNGVLTIGSDNQGINTDVTITETESSATSTDMPWLAAIGSKDVVTSVVTNAAAKVAPTNLNYWFANYINLASFAGAGFDTVQATSVAGLFEGDTKLATVTGIDEWDVRAVSNYSRAFYNCSALRALDISGWNMQSEIDGTAVARTEMMKGCSALTSFTIGPDVILEGTSFDDGLASRVPTAGSWSYSAGGSTWFGSTGDVARRYPASKAGVGNNLRDGDITYAWSMALRGRFPSNDNAWWSYNPSNHTLTLGTDAGANKLVTEFETSATSTVLPWHKAGIIRLHTTDRYNNWTGNYVTSIVVNGSLAPNNLAFWFAGYKDVTTINASGMSLSQLLINPAGTLDSVFAGDTALVTLNLTGWGWNGDISRNLMFANLPVLATLTLDRNAVLEGTGFGCAADGTTPLASRVQTVGRWDMDTNSADTPWFDCTNQLVVRYGADKNATLNYGASSGTPKTLAQIVTATHTYTWNSALGGRFPSNLFAWWTFANGVLTLGVEQSATDKTVSEYDGTLVSSTDTTVLPWLASINGKTKITSIVTRNSLAPLNMTGWFADLSKLTTFDGIGLNPANSTSIHKLFYKDVLLTTINNISDWGVSNVTDFSYSFAELSSLTALTAIAGWTVESATTFAHMFENDVKLVRLHLATGATRWYMPSNAIFTDMFKNLRELIYLKVSNGVILDGPAKDSGFNNNLVDHAPKNGTWAQLVDDEHEYENIPESLIGNTGDLAARYPETHNEYYTITYKFLEGFMRGRFQNTNVWWQYNKGELSVGVDDPTLSVEVTEYEAADKSVTMPWRSLIEDPNNDPVTIVKTFVSSPSLGIIKPHTLEAWFKGYTQLTSFDGTGLDLSLTTSMSDAFNGCTALESAVFSPTMVTTGKLVSLKNLFNGCTKLTRVTGLGDWDTTNVTTFENAFAGAFSRMDSNNKVIACELDIHGWYMDGANNTGMLSGCKNLRTLILGQGVRLGDAAGFNNSLDGLDANDGMWVYTNDEGDEVWFDCTTRLSDRYSGSDQGRAPPTGTIKYIWDSTRLGGRFMSNQNAWWYYVKSTKALHLGADGGANADKRIDATDSTASNLPWRQNAADGTTIIANYATSILTVQTKGNLAPASLASWFDAHTALTTFDGAGLDTQYVVSMASAFRGCTALTTVKGITTWNTPALISLESMFQGDVKLTSLQSVSSWDVSHVTTFANMFNDCWRLQYVTGTSGWDTSSATTFANMFRNMRNLIRIDLSSWTIDADDIVTNMFTNDEDLVEVTFGAGYDATCNDGNGIDEPSRTRTIHFNSNNTQHEVEDCTHNNRPGYSASWGHTWTFGNTHTSKITLTFVGGYDVRGWSWYGTYAARLRVWDSDGNQYLNAYDTSRGSDWTITTTATYLYVSLSVDNYAGYSDHGFHGVVTLYNEGVWKNFAPDPYWIGSWDDLNASNREEGIGQDAMAGTYQWRLGEAGGRFDSNLKAWWEYHRDTKVLDLHGPVDNYKDKIITEAVTADANQQPWMRQNWHFLKLREQAVGITTSDGLTLQNPANWFADYLALVNVDVNELRISSTATSLEKMFFKTKPSANFTTLSGLDKWSVSSITSMAHMFEGNTALNITGIGAWNTANVTDFSYMFSNVLALNDLTGVADWNTSSATNMAFMFHKTGITTLDRLKPHSVSVDGMTYEAWDTSKVTNFESMFAACVDLLNAEGIANWVVANANLANMFNGDTALLAIDVSGWDMLSAPSITGMFVGNKSLAKLRLGLKSVLAGTGITNDLEDHGVADGKWMREDGRWYDSSNNLTAIYPTAGPKYQKVYLYTWDTMPGGRFQYGAGIENAWWRYDKVNHILFIGTSDIEASDDGTFNYEVEDTYDILPWLPITGRDNVYSVVITGGIKLINPIWWFKDYTALIDFDGDGLDLSMATDNSVEGFLMGCTALTTVTGIDKWADTLHSIKDLFNGDSSLTQLSGIEFWLDTSHITNMSGAFMGTSSLTELSFLRNWDVSNVTDFSNMFNGATGLTSLNDIRVWNIANALNLSGMFANTKLTDVELTPWDVSTVTNFSSMFEGCADLATLNISTWDMTNATNPDGIANMFKGCKSLVTVVFGEKNVLSFGGTNPATAGFDDTLTDRSAYDGRWQLRGGVWYDGTARLADRYAFGSQIAGTLTYDWQNDSPGGHFIKNPSAWWTFDKVTGTLTIGIDAGATDLDIPELDEELPWRLYQYQKFHDNMRAVVFRNDAAPLNPASWFENYNFIERFEGGSMDPFKATDFSNMFAGCTALTDLVGISNWNLASATNLSKMFFDCDSLATLVGIAGWNVSTVQDFSSMFAQALNNKNQVVGIGLVDASAIKRWNFAAATTLEGMFQNCVNLTTVDFSGWDLTTSAPNLTNMLANDVALSKMTLGPGSVLVGAGFDQISTRTDSDGRWYMPNYTWFGDRTDMENRYGTAGNSLGASLVYTWDGTTLGGRFKNQNTWWTYDKASKLLTIGSDNGGNKTITETADELPWKDIPGLANVLSVNTNGTTIIINPANWFANYSALTSFDGTDTNVTGATDLSGMFEGDIALKTITGVDEWDTSAALTMANMFKGCTSLTNTDALVFWNTSNVTDFSGIFSGDTALASINLTGWDMRSATTVEGMLAGCTGLTQIMLGNHNVLAGAGLDDTLAGRTKYDGVWVRADGLWFDRSTYLSDLYPLGGNECGDDLIYTWDNSFLGGRFKSSGDPSKEKAWWKYIKATRTLDLGTDGTEPVAVTERYDQLPWRDIETVGFATSITSHGHLMLPEDASYWFASSMIDHGDATVPGFGSWGGSSASFSVNGNAITIHGISGWSFMYAPVSLDAGTYYVHFNYTMPAYGTFFEITNNLSLANQHAIHTGNLVSPGAYTWLNATSTPVEKVVEFTVPSARTVYLVLYIDTVSDGNSATLTINDFLVCKNPAYWLVSSFDGTGLDPSNTKNLTGFFQDDSKLSTVQGTAAWNTSKVEDFSMMFEDCVSLSNLARISTWNTSSALSMARMFAGCTSLQNNDDIAGWNTHKVTDFQGMFENCKAFTSLDVSGWDMQSSVVPDGMTGMVSGCTALNTVIASGLSVLVGSGLDDTLPGRARWDGVWEIPDGTWFDSSQRLAERYPHQSIFNERITYRWNPSVRGGRFVPNGPSWWRVSDEDGDGTFETLLIGTDSNRDFAVATEAQDLPWLLVYDSDPAVSDAKARSTIKYVYSRSTDIHIPLIIDRPASWFEGYTALTLVDATYFDVGSAFSMANMFKGCTALTQIIDIETWSTQNITDFSGMFQDCSSLISLNISGWVMRMANNLTDMLTGCSALESLTVGGTVVLEGSGLSDTLRNHARWDGMWELADGSWFDCSDRLAERYPLYKSGERVENFPDTMTYLWNGNVRGGRFEPNGPTWWKVTDEDEDGAYETLTLGTDRASAVVREEAADLPWLLAFHPDVQESTEAAKRAITVLRTQTAAENGGLIIAAPSAWFQDYVNLRTADVSNMDILGATSLKDMFKGDAALADIVGIDTWTTNGGNDIPAVSDYSGMFSGCASLGNETLARLSSWNVSGATTMAAMFEGCASITDLSPLTGWDISNVTDLSRMFAGCAGIVDQRPIAGWDTTNVSTFAEMFRDCTKLKELDLSTWQMAGRDVTDMLTGCKALYHIKTGQSTVLEGTGLANLIDHTQEKGTWFNTDRSWYDGSAILAAHYPASGNMWAPDDYYFEAIIQGRFDSNNNVWWRYNLNDHSLTLGLADPNESNVVTEGRNGLPWGSLAPPDLPDGKTIFDLIEHVYVDGDDTLIKIMNPAFWFQNHVALRSVEAEKLDISGATSLEGMFQGDHKLASLNLSKWDMTKPGLNLTNLLDVNNANAERGDIALNELVLGPNSILEGTGFEGIASHVDYAGQWLSSADSTFRGTNAQLLAKYMHSGSRPAGTITYTWELRSSAPANPDFWWQFFTEETTFNGVTYAAGTLIMGVADLNNDGVIETTVSGISPDNPPWLPWLPSVAKSSVNHIVIDASAGARMHPVTLERWFAGYTNLLTFDGRGMDTAGTESFAQLFDGDSKLEYVDISTWDMRPQTFPKPGEDSEGNPVTIYVSTSYAHMFRGTNLKTIALGPLSNLQDTGFNGEVANRTANDGMWRTDPSATTSFDHSWFETSAGLTTRYDSDGNHYGERVVFTWVPGKGGHFVGNANAWWAFDAAANTLYLGSVDGKQTVTCAATNLPWRGIVNTATVENVVTYGELAPTDMTGWFAAEPFTYDIPDGVYRIRYMNHSWEEYLTASSNTGLDTTGANSVITDGNSLDAFWRITYVGTDANGKYYTLYNIGRQKYMRAPYLNDDRDTYFYIRNFSTSGYNRVIFILRRDVRYILDRNSGTSTNYTNWHRNDYQERWHWTTANEDQYYQSDPNRGSNAYAWSLELVSGGFESLKTFDGTGLDFTDTTTVENMFGRNKTLEKITLGEYNYLTGSGLLAHQGHLGSWITESDPDWWGTTSNLVNRYPAGFRGVGNNVGNQTYIWNPDHIGGRFPSNDAAWWRYFDKETEYKGVVYAAGTLLLGVDNVETSTTKSTDVTEAGPTMPWMEVLTAGSIKHVKTSDQTGSRLHPLTVKSWFDNSNGYYANLVDADLSKLQVDAQTTSFEKLFYKASALESVDISSWSMISNPDSRANMFGEAPKLVELTLGNGVILTNAGINHPDDVAARWRVEYTDGTFQNRDFKVGDFYVTNGTDSDPGLLALYRNNPSTWGVIRWHWYPGTIIRWHNNSDSVSGNPVIAGHMPDVFVPYDFDYQMPNPTKQSEGGSAESGFQLENYRLNWWNTLARPTKDNPGHEFKAGETVVPTAKDAVFGNQYTDLYAQWAPIRYTILKFSAAGATGGAKDIVGDAGTDVVIPDYNKGENELDHFYQKGYDIIGWSTQEGGKGTIYRTGDLYRLRWESVADLGIDVELVETEDPVTHEKTQTAIQRLYAMWAPHGGFVLQFNLNGGSPAMADRTDILWDQAGLVPEITPTRDGYEFDGWYYKHGPRGADRREHRV